MHPATARHAAHPDIIQVPTMRVLIFSALVATTLQAQEPPAFADPHRADKVTATASAVEGMLREYAEQQRMPGFAYGVVLDGELLYSGSFGLANIDEVIPAGTETLFRIASMSKSVTALAILQLRDEGKLALDDPASLYVPEMTALRHLAADAPTITIRHLLTHSAGFPEDNPWGDRQLADSDGELRALIAGGVSFSNVPGIEYEYSNLGFALLGQIVQVVSGMDFRDYTRQHVFEPLGMHSTVWEYERAPANRLALGYDWLDGSWVNIPLEHHGSFGAMGGLITSSLRGRPGAIQRMARSAELRSGKCTSRGGSRHCYRTSGIRMAAAARRRRHTPTDCAGCRTATARSPSAIAAGSPDSAVTGRCCPTTASP
jgi:CubicO group peptidase (beta-lactamase class C family)